MSKLSIYNENALLVKSDKLMCLCVYGDYKAWLSEDEIEIPPLEIIDKYREIRAVKNYHPIRRMVESKINNQKEFVFTDDGRDQTLLINDLKFVSYV